MPMMKIQMNLLCRRNLIKVAPLLSWFAMFMAVTAAAIPRPAYATHRRATKAATEAHPSYMTLRYKSHVRECGIEASYPHFIGLGRETYSVNERILQFVQKEIRSGCKRFSLGEGLQDQPPGYIRGRYSVLFLDHALFSIRFSFSGYAPGAAHSYDWTAALNYDIQDRKSFDIVDCFQKPVDPIELLSLLSQNELLKNVDDFNNFEWIDQSAGDTKESFATLNFDSTGLILTFDEYKLNAYGAGPYFLTIPYFVIRNVISSQCKLGTIAHRAVLGKATYKSDFAPIYLNDYQRQLSVLGVGVNSRILFADPTNGRAYYRRGKCYQALKRTDAALDDFKKALENGYEGLDKSE